MEALERVLRERIGLVAKNPMRIAGIQGVFGDPCGVEIVSVSLNDALRSHPAEIVLIDAGSMSPLFEVLSQFREACPEVRLIVIGVDADDTYIECVIAAGVKGYVGADALAPEVRVALENVRDGSIWAPRKVLSRLILNQVTGRSSPQVADLAATSPQFTSREGQVIALLVDGQTNREIAAHLGIDAVTVKAHLSRIMRKAGVANRIELTMYALSRRASSKSQQKLNPAKA